MKKSDFIITKNYDGRLRLNTAKLLIEKIKNNFNRRYKFKNKKYNLENIMVENIKELNRYSSGKQKTFEFKIPDIEISRNNAIDVQKKIMSIDPEMRIALKINKSTLWCQQKNIKVGKTIKTYNKIKVRVE